MKSNDFAIKVNIKHSSIMLHISKNIEIFKELGEIKTYKLDSGDKGGRPEQGYILNDLHIKFLITLLKNDNFSKLIKKDIILNKFDIDNFKKEPKMGHVYVIKNNNGHKIGSSINPEQRIRTIETQQGCKVEIILISNKRYDYKVKETELHNKYKGKHIMGEYFDLTDEDIMEITCYLSGMSQTSFKFAASKWLYDSNRKAFYDLYLIDIINRISGNSTKLHILPSTVLIAKKIMKENESKTTSEICKILRDELPKFIDLIYSL